jgi:pSer/pThr/pTyr-binding forkhead associated (FHA) protein
VQVRLLIANTATGAVQTVDCELNERLIVGRTPNSPVQLEGPLISREHFVLTSVGGRTTVRDLSSNGTWFKDQRLSKDSQQEINSGDSIFVPGYRVEIQIPEPEPQEAPSPALSETAQGEVADGVLALQGASGTVPSEPVAADTAEEAQPTLPWLKPVYDFLGSFSKLEWFLSLAALCCFCVVLFYVLS